MSEVAIDPNLIRLAAFGGASALAYSLVSQLFSTDARTQQRLDELAGGTPDPYEFSRTRYRQSPSFVQWSRSTLSRIGRKIVPASEQQQNALRVRLAQAGFYARTSVSVFAGIRAVLTIVPLIGFAVAIVLGQIDFEIAIYFGSASACLGAVGPSFWLDRLKAKRQKLLRRALPDFLDLIVACLDGGMTFESALNRVTDELQTAHPELATEMLIVQQEIAIGRTADQALQSLADRCGLEEVGSLATFVNQAKRLGMSMIDPIRTNSEVLRNQRQQRAEELAQSASVKIMFPTLFFIFPVIVGVLVGPAAIEIHQKLDQPALDSAAEETFTQIEDQGFPQP